MGKVKISFLYNKENDEITELEVIEMDGVPTPSKKVNAPIKLTGSSLQLNSDVLIALESRIDTRLVMEVDSGYVTLTNVKYSIETIKGNKITGKLTVSCRGQLRKQIEKLGTEFRYERLHRGKVRLVPINDLKIEENELAVALTLDSEPENQQINQ